MEMRRRRAMAVAVGAVIAAVAACAPASGPLGNGPWTWRELRVELPERSQGLATDDASGSADTWYSSQFTLERAAGDGSSLGVTWSLPLDVLLVGKYSHTGDIDVHDGKLVVPWENKQLGPSDPPAKAFGVYDAASLELRGWARHVLVPGESADNPWVTVSPDGRWLVSGPYAPLDRLQVFPMPDAQFADLPLSSEIPLDVAAHDVQGCDFATTTQLVCASNDGTTAKQIFTLDLDAPVGEGASRATLTYRGSAPQAPPLLGEAVGCPTSGEVEGIDAQHDPERGTVVRILVVDRCLLVVHEYEHVIEN